MAEELKREGKTERLVREAWNAAIEECLKINKQYENPISRDEDMRGLKAGAKIAAIGVGITSNERLIQSMPVEEISKFADNSVFAKEIWDSAVEAAGNIFHEAQDTDFDLGFETARKMIRSLKK